MGIGNTAETADFFGSAPAPSMDAPPAAEPEGGTQPPPAATATSNTNEIPKFYLSGPALSNE